jgi:hypothetical protein
MSWIVHLHYNLMSGIITIWLPNQDNGIFLEKDDLYVYEGYRLIYGLKGNPVKAMDACGQQWLCLWYGRLSQNTKFLRVSRSPLLKKNK